MKTTMNRSFKVLVALANMFVSISSAQISFSPNTLHQITKSEALKAHLTEPVPELTTGQEDYDIVYHRCEWNIDPSQYYIAGKVTTYFTSLIASLDSVVFNLSNSLSVDSVWHQNTTVSFIHASDLLIIYLPSPITQNQLDSVSIFYHGAPNNSGFGSFDTASHNGVPALWTLSEPYGGSDWWPCKNTLSDKADSLDVWITTPSQYKAASNGILVATTNNGSQTTYYWKHRYPIATYLICLAVTNYVEYSHYVPFGSTITEVLHYVYPEDSATAAAQTPYIVPIMQLYDTLFGVYPFVNEKYGHCQFGWGGGMEHQTFSFMGGFDFELQAHELAHQWFGDKITCGSWEDIWLNEGFATYLSGLCYEHLAPFWWPVFISQRMNYVTSQPDGSVWCNDTTDVNRIFDGRLSYAKGSMILHQLRWVMGDSAFFAAINNYLNDPVLQYGYARTYHLKSHLESAYGSSLTWYFNDWFTGEGYPSYQIGWSQTGNIFQISIYQTQSHNSVSFFELPLPFKLVGQQNDTMIRLMHSYSGESFSFPVSFQVTNVLFDPDKWIISKNNVITALHQPVRPAQTITLYPNPCSEQVHITTPSETFTLRLYNMEGQLLREKHYYGNDAILETTTLPQGCYHIEVTTPQGKYHQKLTIMRE